MFENRTEFSKMIIEKYPETSDAERKIYYLDQSYPNDSEERKLYMSFLDSLYSATGSEHLKYLIREYKMYKKRYVRNKDFPY